MGYAGLGLLRQHGSPVAQLVYDQLAFPPVRTPSLRDGGYQPQQPIAGAADVWRRMAQQPPSLHGLGAAGILLVGSGYQLLRVEGSVVVLRGMRFASATSR